MRRFLLCFTTGILIAATSTAYASDPCQTLLCMAGKLQGQNGGDNCDDPINDYFSIVRFGKHGRFDAGKTASARLDLLNGCNSPDVGNWPTDINAAYGTVRSGW